MPIAAWLMSPTNPVMPWMIAACFVALILYMGIADQ
jgi:hypothetical protein